MEIRIIKIQPISRQELKKIAEQMFGNLVKAVVDVEQEIIAVGGEFHSDAETLLSEQEKSKREYTWGVNLYPEKSYESSEFIEFDSMVNLKPAFGNRSRGVDDEKTRGKIVEVIKKLVIE